MRNRILGGIGVVWGGAMLVSAFLRGGPDGAFSREVVPIASDEDLRREWLRIEDT